MESRATHQRSSADRPSTARHRTSHDVRPWPGRCRRGRRLLGQPPAHREGGCARLRTRCLSAAIGMAAEAGAPPGPSGPRTHLCRGRLGGRDVVSWPRRGVRGLEAGAALCPGDRAGAGAHAFAEGGGGRLLVRSWARRPFRGGYAAIKRPQCGPEAVARAVGCRSRSVASGVVGGRTRAVTGGREDVSPAVRAGWLRSHRERGA